MCQVGGAAIIEELFPLGVLVKLENVRIGQAAGNKRVGSRGDCLNHRDSKELVTGGGDKNVGLLQGLEILLVGFKISPLVDVRGEFLLHLLEGIRSLAKRLAQHREPEIHSGGSELLECLVEDLGGLVMFPAGRPGDPQGPAARGSWLAGGRLIPGDWMVALGRIVSTSPVGWWSGICSRKDARAERKSSWW